MAKNNHYLKEVVSELAVLGYGNIQEPATYADMYRLLTGVSASIYCHDDPERVKRADLNTPFAQTILDLSGIRFEPENIQSCGRAEDYFLRDLRPEANREKAVRSPVIFTCEDKAVAFLKSDGVATSYVLRDEPGYDLYQGCIYDIGNPAFSIENEPDAIFSVDIAEAQSITPGRLSAFLFPVPARQGLLTNPEYPWEKEILNASHGTIVELANEALKNAEPLEDRIWL